MLRFDLMPIYTLHWYFAHLCQEAGMCIPSAERAAHRTHRSYIAGLLARDRS